MKISVTLSLFGVLLLGGLLRAGAATPTQLSDTGTFAIREGDTPVVFLGDSITEMGQYPALIEGYVLTRFPKWKVTFRNVGWSGDTAWLSSRGDFEESFRRDVQSLNPKILMINYGMNDASRGTIYYPKYLNYATRLVQLAQAMGTKVILLTTSPVEIYQGSAFPPGSPHNKTLKQFADGLRGVAGKEHAIFVDQFSPMLEAIERGRKQGILGTDQPPRLTADGCHPNWDGAVIMAASILTELKAPSFVSRLTIDGRSGQVIESSGCSVAFSSNTMFQAGRSLTFQRVDDALPWPIPNDAKIALKLSSFAILFRLNRYELKVVGLLPSSYALAIDGERVGTFSDQELAYGINLARYSSPLNAQGDKLLEVVLKKNALFRQRWQNVQLSKRITSEDARQQMLVHLDRSIADLEGQITALRQPKPHLFSISPIDRSSLK